MKIGTDIVEIDRVQRALAKTEHFKQRVFTEVEMSYCEGRGKQCVASYAGIFAAKEAFVKALGVGFRQGSWQEICIGHDAWGAPVLQVSGTFQKLLIKSGYTRISLSISHSREYATAQVLLWK